MAHSNFTEVAIDAENNKVIVKGESHDELGEHPELIVAVVDPDPERGRTRRTQGPCDEPIQGDGWVATLDQPDEPFENSECVLVVGTSLADPPGSHGRFVWGEQREVGLKPPS